MYAQCPQCHTRFKVQARQLRSGRGKVRCGQCGAAFDALATLTESLTETAEKPEKRPQADPPILAAVEPAAGDTYRITAPLPWETAEPSPIRSTLWGVGILLLVLGLIGQFAAFEGPRLAREPRARPWLAALCTPPACTLPPYKDLRALDILDHRLGPAGDYLEFRAILVNRADFSQPLPVLRLNLISFAGHPFAERFFMPDEYHAHGPAPDELATGVSVEIHLLIAQPVSGIGGYRFELI